MNDDRRLEAMLEAHPCYNERAHRKFARMHLPVAPHCNIQCNYCDRRYDCMNESRPGVTSDLLTPEEAVEKIRYVITKVPYLSVIGIAGPGDPLANEETFRTLELVREEFSDLTICMSTNGLALPENVDRLKELGLRFLTVTVNAVDPDVGARIYDFVRWGGKTLKGKEAAERLIGNQLDGIKRAVAAGMLVKVNVVMIPGINADHIPEVAKKARELGAYIVNILPLIPVPGTKFGNLRAPTAKERKELQDMCEVDIRQMRHCKQCRADAIGLLGEDRSAEFAHYTCAGRVKGETTGDMAVEMEGDTKHRIAVASSDGLRVDEHFGQATLFHTYLVDGETITESEPITSPADMDAPLFGPAHRERIEAIAERLHGMDAVIATQFGDMAVEALRRRGMIPIEDRGDIHEAVLQARRSVFKERAVVFE